MKEKLEPFPFPSSSSKAFFKFVNHTDLVANEEKIFKGTAIQSRLGFSSKAGSNRTVCTKIDMPFER